jgi:hypothetical protein
MAGALLAERGGPFRHEAGGEITAPSSPWQIHNTRKPTAADRGAARAEPASSQQKDRRRGGACPKRSRLAAGANAPQPLARYFFFIWLVLEFMPDPVVLAVLTAQVCVPFFALLQAASV